MANQEHLNILKQGVKVWNQWREEHPAILPDLTGADLRGGDLRRVNLSKANLNRANFYKANLSMANLHKARLRKSGLTQAYLNGTDLSQAYLNGANLTKANLNGANLSGAVLNSTALVGTNLEHANLTGCSIHGISVWNVQLKDAVQSNLVITQSGEPTITVDNLEVAQFIYLLLNNERIRQVIDSITSKAVLILGRFSSERGAVLDALRDELRKLNYSPILFDFEKPVNRDMTETVSTLAYMARFVIADITDAKSIPQELDRIVPDLPLVPVQPLILSSQHEYGMFEHFTRYPWVLSIYRYTDEVSLMQSLKVKVIAPAEQKAREIASNIGK